MNSRDVLRIALADLAYAIDEHIDERIASLGPEPIPTGEYITIRDAAGKLDVHTTTVRRWLNNGSLPGVKVGKGRNGSWRIRRVDLDAVDPSLSHSTSGPTEDGKDSSAVSGAA